MHGLGCVLIHTQVHKDRPYVPYLRSLGLSHGLHAWLLLMLCHDLLRRLHPLLLLLLPLLLQLHLLHTMLHLMRWLQKPHKITSCCSLAKCNVTGLHMGRTDGRPSWLS